jgi:hypothetical protein
MPRNQETTQITTSDGWVELTSSDAAKFCFQIKSGTAEIRVSVGSVAPLDADRGVYYQTGTGESAITSIFDAIPVVGANRVWARAFGSQSCSILVTHD